MNDEHLVDALRALPRERASASFTADVLRRLETGAVATRWGLRAAAVAALLGVSAAGFVWLDQRQRQERVARLQAMQAEQLRLEAELADLRRLAETPAPLIYLGGNDEVDLVVSWPVLERRMLGATPASFEPSRTQPDNRHGGQLR